MLISLFILALSASDIARPEMRLNPYQNSYGNFISYNTYFLDVPLYNVHFVKLPWNIVFNALKQKVALHILQSLLLTNPFLLTHQEIHLANTRTVG